MHNAPQSGALPSQKEGPQRGPSCYGYRALKAPYHGPTGRFEPPTPLPSPRPPGRGETRGRRLGTVWPPAVWG